MSGLANFKLSLYHEIKTVFLPDWGYVETITDETLTQPDSSVNLYQFAHKNIVYADPSGRINPSGVKIYDAGRQLVLSEYRVNYVDSYVELNITPSGTIKADYQYYTVDVRDAFPTEEEFEAADLPLVCVDLASNTPSDYAIGQILSFWRMDYFIDIFATTDIMRLELMDRLQRHLMKWLPLLDFSLGMPLNYDGTINTGFNWDNQFVKWIKMKGKPIGDLLNFGDVSPKERFRAVIKGSFTDIH